MQAVFIMLKANNYKISQKNKKICNLICIFVFKII